MMARSLCFPDKLKSCFACCPPIRPARYEHSRYKQSTRRFLRENTRKFDPGERCVRPITGFSCWALGYLDKDFRLVGCLLHPAINQGKDLRHRIDYGEKCRREACQESRIFSKLSNKEQSFWLNLCTGLDSFAYSSRVENPLFNLLNWGLRLLKLIAAEESEVKFDRSSFFRAYPIFTAGGRPRARAYLLNGLIDEKNLTVLKRTGFKDVFEVFYNDLKKDITRNLPEEEKGEYIHRLGMDENFQNFLRLSLRKAKMEPAKAEGLKTLADKAVRRLRRDLSGI